MANEYLTNEEIEILAAAIGNSGHFESAATQSEHAEDHFNRALGYVRENSDKFQKMTLEQIFRWFYELGLNTEVNTPEMSIQDVFDLVESNQFIQQVQEWLDNPEPVSRVSVDSDENKVTLISECIGAECECSPNREDCCTHDYGKHCSLTIPMSRFNKMINL